ncbi:hypothetical protein [Bacteriovorax sp. Seq25_V]|uniref:hypothetical protein n=1 Tax=Bacteriovorax sp. Seq25_V TaxID=1201288 RepID=UPI00038A3AB3|nr:hypothetical protein [Bacteriovorax sp. Seq25_V]EQC44259.1 hypothetical protein M900_A0446 [Bacteriovorax sp. Seq25_V]
MKSERKLLISSLLFSTLVSGTVSADFKKSAKDLGIEKLKLSLGAGYTDLAGSIDKAKLFNSSLNVETRANISNDIYLNLNLTLSSETGSSKAQYDQRRFTPKSGYYAKYAYLSYNVLELFDLYAGALDNNDEDSSDNLIASGASSMGVREKVSFENDFLKMSAVATQSSPYNDELSNRFDNIDEGEPRFFSEFINIKFKLGRHAIDLKGAQYAYKNLSSSLAYNDKYYGNTVSGTSESNSLYVYGFKGKMLKASTTLALGNSLTITPAMKQVKNNNADSGHDTGKVYELSASTEVLDNKVTLSMSDFSVDSDTTVSYYNSSPYKNNYEGKTLELKIENPESLTTTISYVDRKVKTPQFYLSDEKIIKINLRKSYDIL